MSVIFTESDTFGAGTAAAIRPSLPVLTMQLYNPGDAVVSPKATLENGFARSFVGHFGDAGGGSITLLQSDPDLALLDYDDWIRCFLDGVCVFSFIVERIVRKVVDEGEESKQVAVITGPGFGSLLDNHKLYPPYGPRPLRSADSRLYGYPGLSHDRSSWSAGPLVLQYGTDPTSPWYPKAPFGWPDPLAAWITHLPAGDEQEPGDGYYANVAVSPIASFTLPMARTVRVFAATDNGGDVYIDETLIYSLAANDDPAGWDQTQAYDLDLDAGDHFVAMKLTNFGPFVGFNPGAWIMAIYTLKSGGSSLDTVVLRTDGTTNWLFLDRPATVPGSTAGRIVGQVLAEGTARGATYVTTDATDSLDSRGAAWNATTDTGIQVGTKGLALVQELAETYCDFDFDPDFPVLHLYNPGTAGTDRSGSVSFAAQVNLTSLEIDGTAKSLANVLLIRYAKGYAEVVDSASVAAHGRREDFLQLGQQPTIAQVQAIAQALFARISEHEVSITGTILPTGPVGFVDYFPGDMVTCDGEDGPGAVRVIAITVAEDANGVVQTIPQLSTLKEVQAMNLTRQVNRLVPGALGSVRG